MDAMYNLQHAMFLVGWDLNHALCFMLTGKCRGTCSCLCMSLHAKVVGYTTGLSPVLYVKGLD